ncbi:MAG: hypothetical protein IH859_02485 [Chloroflexi bacterium]|nr:hypothetical protein [Chloroflexota bacterium]
MSSLRIRAALSEEAGRSAQDPTVPDVLSKSAGPLPRSLARMITPQCWWPAVTAPS